MSDAPNAREYYTVEISFYKSGWTWWIEWNGSQNTNEDIEVRVC